MKLLRPTSGGAGIFFPIGKPPKGTCQYATSECLEKCCALEKDYDEEYNVSDEDKWEIYKFMIDEPNRKVCFKIVKEMEELQVKIIHWFTTGDCMDKDIQSLVTIMKRLNRKQVVQCGFTRNRKLYYEHIQYNKWLCIVPSFRVENSLYGIPNYETGAVELYYNDVYCGEDGRIVVTANIKGRKSETTANCLGCYRRKIGCFLKPPRGGLNEKNYLKDYSRNIWASSF